MPGDRFCEWRHFPYHPKFPTKMIVLVPNNVEVQYFPSKEKVQQLGTWYEVDYSDLNVLHYLDDDHRLVVIYDQHLRLASRTKLWAHVVTQLLNRDPGMLDQKAVGLLFHEAGILFPQNAVGQQWLAVDEFSERFVECRKGLVRNMMVSQIDTEIESTIRGKCMYGIIRKSTLNKSWPKLVRKVAPFTALNQYQLVLGKGLYLLDNQVGAFYEKKSIFKMVPMHLIDGGLTSQDPPEKNSSTSLECRSCGHVWLPKVNHPLSCPLCRKYFGYNKVRQLAET